MNPVPEQTKRYRERRKQKRLNILLWVKSKDWELLDVAVEHKKKQVVREKLEELKEKGRRKIALNLYIIQCNYLNP